MLLDGWSQSRSITSIRSLHVADGKIILGTIMSVHERNPNHLLLCGPSCELFIKRSHVISWFKSTLSPDRWLPKFECAAYIISTVVVLGSNLKCTIFLLHCSYVCPSKFFLTRVLVGRCIGACERCRNSHGSQHGYKWRCQS